MECPFKRVEIMHKKKVREKSKNKSMFYTVVKAGAVNSG